MLSTLAHMIRDRRNRKIGEPGMPPGRSRGVAERAGDTCRVQIETQYPILIILENAIEPFAQPVRPRREADAAQPRNTLLDLGDADRRQIKHVGLSPDPSEGVGR